MEALFHFDASSPGPRMMLPLDRDSRPVSLATGLVTGRDALLDSDSLSLFLDGEGDSLPLLLDTAEEGTWFGWRDLDSSWQSAGQRVAPL